MFLKTDLVQANKELQCYLDCKLRAGIYIENGDYAKALEEHEVMARSLRELERLRQKKARFEEFASFLIEAKKLNEIRFYL